MTREEAIDILAESKRQNEVMRDNPSTFWVSHQMADGVKNAERRIAALNLALSALRPVSREQVERERDAAVSDLTFVVNQYRLETTGIDLCGLCEYDLPPVGENGQTAECPGFYVNDCFKWRGPEEG